MLLERIDVKNYKWQMMEEEFVYIRNDRNESIPIPQSVLSGSTMDKLMKLNYEIVMINLRAFPIGTIITEPKDYNEYLDSECFLVFLLADTRFIAIYCKDEDFLRCVYNHYKDDPEIECIEIITDENDVRKRFYVW